MYLDAAWAPCASPAGGRARDCGVPARGAPPRRRRACRVPNPALPSLLPPLVRLGLQNSVRLVRDLFHDADTTEFIIATIPTVLGVNESARLAGALRREGVPCSRIVVNQVIDDRLARK